MTPWDDLQRHYDLVKNRRITELFENVKRPAEFSVIFGELLFDYSKTNIDTETQQALLALVNFSELADKRAAMFAGAPINETESRAVLHTALRNLGQPLIRDGVDIIADARATHARLKTFTEDVRAGRLQGQGGAFTDIVNIGIGGSDLGPAMACLALTPYADGPRCHFIANIDGADIHDTLRRLDPTTTLVIIASKTFTTIETMTNAEAVRAWLAASVETPAAHFAAVSTALDKTAAFGIAADRVFGFDDWVGGRYSLWGPIGLALMLAIGAARFDEFLAGGSAMDAHFRAAPWQENMPVMLALTGIWHNQICGYASRAVLPYEQRLLRLPAYLQQLEMESNGKGVDMEGRELSQHSGPIVWGEPGTNGQHAFYQLIHQGTRIVPCEFLLGRVGHEPELAHQHHLLAANCLAQSEALMRGRSLDEARAIMAAKGLSGAELDRQARHRVFPGNRPSTTLLYPKLTPFTLGQIIALYEHRVFVEGVILGINSFDQWGVELGKELALTMAPILAGGQSAEGKDGSTRMLVDYLRRDRS